MNTRRYTRILPNIVSIMVLTFGLVSAGTSKTNVDDEIAPESDKTTADEETAPQAERTPEEIIVYGQTNVIILRNALYRAEESFFDLYNSLNSHDQFDVECKNRQKSIQERRKEHRCAPSFALEYEAWVTARFMRGMSNGFIGMLDPAFANLEYQARVRVKEREMRAEMEELIEANPEFLEKIEDLEMANDALAAEMERRGPCPKIFCRK